MQNSIRILHLSDIHYSKEHQNDFDNKIMSPLMIELDKINNNKNIDIVCITGDLIDKGKGGFSSTAEALNNFSNFFIEPIVKKLNIDRSNIFFVPGNHDVDITKDDKYTEKGLKEELVSKAEVDEFVNFCISGNTKGIERVVAFNEFEKVFYAATIHKDNPALFCSTYKLNIRGIGIGISCVNSAWRYYDKESKLIISENQIQESLNKINANDVKIFLSHYDKDFLCDFQKDSIDDFVTENYDIALLGHKHSTKSRQTNVIRGELFANTARGNWTGNISEKNIDLINGFSVIDYDLQNSKIYLYPKVYSLKLNTYVNDAQISGDEGVIVYQLKKKETNLQKLHAIAKHIKETFLQDINEDLITFGTDTKAPITLSEIFVEPNLAHRKGKEPEDEEIISIETICKQDSNYMIFGAKETGKTILLGKIVFHFIENINELHSIPVYIKYEEYRHNRIDTAISRFTGISIKEIANFIGKEKIVLLIDNLKFDERDKYFINDLIKLTKKYENLKILITVSTSNNENIPLEYVDSQLYGLCEVLRLKYFKTKQISDLTEKWFLNQGSPSRNERQKKIISFLTTLRIPTTPLAISMFLWMLEKQEEYQPVNQAAMLENFIERLFKKHKKKKMLYKDFDFKNREKLLAAIAKKMLDVSKENYSLTLPETLELCSEYLKNRKFDFNIEEILNQFIDVGILTKYNIDCDVYVRFRFSCFFQYFLMKNMENADFLKYVMSKENYLTFADEIILFTGIKRDQSEILQALVDRMRDMFKELSEDIGKLPKGYDSFFDVKLSYAEQLDKGFIDHIGYKKEEIKKEVEAVNDKMLETVNPNAAIQRKDFKLSTFQRLEKSWELAASVLRNTEETDVQNLKYTSYKEILNSSFAFLCLYKFFFIEYLRKKKNDLGEKEMQDSTLMIKFLPILHELMLSDFMSSVKLTLVFKDHIENIMDDTTKTELEKFVAVFLYADNKGKNYIGVIKRFISQIKCRYIYDMTLFKLLSYYHFRSDSRTEDMHYESMIADLIMAARKTSSNKQRVQIISDLKKKRKQKKLNSNENTLF